MNRLDVNFSSAPARKLETCITSEAHQSSLCLLIVSLNTTLIYTRLMWLPNNLWFGIVLLGGVVGVITASTSLQAHCPKLFPKRSTRKRSFPRAVNDLTRRFCSVHVPRHGLASGPFRFGNWYPSPGPFRHAMTKPAPFMGRPVPDTRSHQTSGQRGRWGLITSVFSEHPGKN